MKKILISIFIICSLFSISCADDSIVIPDVVSDRYKIEVKTKNSTTIPSLYINAKNNAGGIDIVIPNESDGQKKFIKNEELQNFIELYLESSSNEVMTMINRLNYIDFISNGNLKVSYNGEDGSEIIFPDMLLNDGSLERTFKYRRNFDRLFLRITEPLSRFLKIPLMGELALEYTFCYKIVNNGYLIFADYKTIKAYSEMLQLFGLDDNTIEMIKQIIDQYKYSEDTLEIGIYLKSVD